LKRFPKKERVLLTEKVTQKDGAHAREAGAGGESPFARFAHNVKEGFARTRAEKQVAAVEALFARGDVAKAVQLASKTRLPEVAKAAVKALFEEENLEAVAKVAEKAPEESGLYAVSLASAGRRWDLLGLLAGSGRKAVSQAAKEAFTGASPSDVESMLSLAGSGPEENFGAYSRAWNSISQIGAFAGEEAAAKAVDAGFIAGNFDSAAWIARNSPLQQVANRVVEDAVKAGKWEFALYACDAMQGGVREGAMERLADLAIASDRTDVLLHLAHDGSDALLERMLEGYKGRKAWLPIGDHVQK
jgi:hypothetical protein